MPHKFLRFNRFRPDGGQYGRELDRMINVLPIHGGGRSLRKKTAVASVADGPPTGAYIHIFADLETSQTARPASTLSHDRWYPVSDPTDGTVLHEEIDETLASDADRIVSGARGGSDRVASVQLSPLETPSTSGDTYVRFRYRVQGTDGGAWSFVWKLTDEGSATVIKSATVSGSGDQGWTDVEYNLTAGEHGNVTNWDDLSLSWTLDSSDPYTAEEIVPESDDAVATWVDEGGAGSDLYESIDEGSVNNDADYIESPALGTAWSPQYKAALAAASHLFKEDDPHIVTARCQATNDGTRVRLKLYKGGTEIASIEDFAGLSFADLDDVLSSSEIDDLEGSYEDLVVGIEAQYDGATAATQFQYARPDSDIDVDQGPTSMFTTGYFWSESSGNGLFYDEIDEVSETSDIIFTNEHVGGGDSTTADALMGLSSVDDPLVDTQHKMFVAGRSSLSTSASIEVELLQGSFTVIKSQSIFLSGFESYDEEIELTEAEAASITDYSDLQVRFKARPESVDVSQFYFEVPEVRKLQVSELYLETGPDGGVEVSWAELEASVTDQSYKGDEPTLFVGTKTKLYEVGSSFTDRSRAAGYGTVSTLPGGWYFSSFGNHVVATNYVEAVQYREDNAGDFKDMIGSTDKPKARFACAARAQVMLGGINPDLTGHHEDEVWWSAVEDLTDFDPDLATLCDYQRLLATPGQIMGLVGGQDVLVFKRRSLYHLQWAPPPIIWHPELIARSIGTSYPRSIVQGQGEVFWWGGDQFYRAIPGQYPQPLGKGVLSRYLTDAEFSHAALKQTEPASMAIEDQAMIGAYDPHSGLVIWIYQGKGDSDYQHSFGVVYNPAEDRWATIEFPAGVNAAHLVQRPNTVDSHTHTLKGLIGLAWDDTDTTWFRFDSNTIFESTFRTKRFTFMGEEEDYPPLIDICSIVPVFSSETKTSWPSLTVKIDSALDPRMVVSTETETLSTDPSDELQEMPFRISGNYFTVEVTVDEATNKIMNSFEGVWIRYERRGRA